ncbi:M14 family metallopeptidase [Planctomycetota bacterium]
MKATKGLILLTAGLLFVGCETTPAPEPVVSMAIRTPAEFFGFELGADKKLAPPGRIIDYFRTLGQLSGRMIFQEVGRTTDDHAFIMGIISSEENILNLEKYRDMNAKLANPRLIGDAEAQQIIRDGKTVVAINAGIHSTEVGPIQALNIVAHKLVTDQSPEIKNLLDNTIVILNPMHNPDGYYMVTEWWNKYLGTEFEGSSMPWLYHRYTGHDDNRDWYFFSQKMTQLTIEHLYEQWHPQIVVDMHQMGSSGARIFVPPFVDPYEHNIDPILQANVNMLGTYMLNRMTAQGLAGVESHNRYDAWTPGRAFQHYHGAVRILTETASVGLAAPINVPATALERGGYLKRSVFHPLPWLGGEWKLKDVVDYNTAAAMSVIENAAFTRRTWLSNFYEVGKNAVAEKTYPFAVIIPSGQRDPFTTKWLIKVLQTGMVEVHFANEPFSADGRRFEAGSAIIYMNQPYYSFAKTLLENQVYPQFTQYPGGPLMRPYDYVAHTLPLLMGVNVAWINNPFSADTNLTTGPEINPPIISTGPAPHGFIISHNTNAMYIVANRLLGEGVDMYWTAGEFEDGGQQYPAGTVIVFAPGNQADKLREIGRELNIDMIARSREAQPLRGYKLKPVKLAHYQSFSGNMSEGWTRWVLEKFEFDAETTHNDIITAGNLNRNFTALLFSNYNTNEIMRGRTGNTPPEYTGGIGAEGVENIKEFVRNGGTLITYGSSNDFAIRELGLQVSNTLSQAGEIVAPGSILKTTNSIYHPIAYGMEVEGNLFYRNAAIFDVQDGTVISRYPTTDDLLLSGWLEGGENLRGKANLVEVNYGEGRVVLIGFDPVYRAQAQGNFKFLFNAMFYGAAEAADIPTEMR